MTPSAAPIASPVPEMERKAFDKANNDRAPLGADLIESKVSLYIDPTDIVGRAEPLSAIWDKIKCGHWEKPTVAIRKARERGDMALADRLKKALPAFTASGVFVPSRKKANLVKPSGLLVVDIDDFESLVKAETARDMLGRDPYVLAAFVSVSGRGVKLLVNIGAVADDAEFKEAWRAFAIYLKEQYGLEADFSGTDIGRLAFASFDQGAVVNLGPILPFTARVGGQNLDPRPSPDQHGPPLEWDIAVVRSALAFISASGNRAEWLRIACAIKNALGEPGYPVFIQWSETCPEKFDAVEARKLWDSLEASKPGGVTVATLFRMAEGRGWKHPGPPPSTVAVATQPAVINGVIVNGPPPMVIYFDQGAKCFLVRDSRADWAPQNEASVKRILRQAGFDPRPRNGEPLSALEAVLVEIQTQYNIHYAGPVAGYQAGLYETPDTRFLVTKGPVIIAAGPSRPWPTLKIILTGMLGEMQLVYLYGWLKVARSALTSGVFAPGQALAIAGPAESAKSLLQALITLMLGGRSARPYQFMAGQTPFNAHMFGAEHQMIEDESPATDFKSRRTLGAMVKSITVNQEQSCHRKHATPVMLKPFWRLSITVNDEPENLMVLPPLDESLEDKIILLKAERRPMPMPTTTPGEREHFWNTLVAELPGLIAHVEAFEIPAGLVSSRFGVTHYHHPELLAKLDDLAPESKLLGYIESVLLLGRSTWQGKAADIERILTDTCCSYSFEARKLFSWPSACGTYLGRLRRRYPDRFLYAQTGEERDRIWTIHARNPAPASAGSTPDLDLTVGSG